MYLGIVKLTLLRLNFSFQADESSGLGYMKNSKEIAYFQVFEA